MKNLRYILEAALLQLLFWGFKALPVENASALGGWLGRMIGPKLATSRKALSNIKHALHDLSPAAHRKAIKEMWDNLGRVLAEYPHLEKIGRDYTTIEGREDFLELCKNGQGIILFGGHIANWEISSAAALAQLEQPIDLTYRAPNNPWSDKLLMKARTINHQFNSYEKSRLGGRQLLEAAKQKRTIGILIDQKYNEGLAVPFFGAPAMTNPIFVQLAQKYNCALVPVRCIRLHGPHFKLKFHAPIPVFDEKGAALPVEEVIATANQYLESWIRAAPGQWLWLHRRWDSGRL